MTVKSQDFKAHDVSPTALHAAQTQAHAAQTQVVQTQVREQLESDFPSLVEDLKALVRIPSISFSGFSADAVEASAQAVARLLKARGLENVEVLHVPGAHPAVYGDWLHAPGAPTVLLYAHHDVQPPGREALWESPPFEPAVRLGPGGERLFGRGTADDKAGILIHLAAISAYLKAAGRLPVNVKVFIEGEEEIGSLHLADFLKKYREQLAADILVLTDTSNFDCGVPALTVSLRGLVGVEVEVRALSKALHSGMWGGPLPDPAMALAKMLATLTDAQGQIAIAGVLEQVRPVSPQEQAEWDRIPYNEAEFRQQSGLVPTGVLLHQHPRLHPLAQIARMPSLTVNAIQASSRAQAGNIINDAAWAKVTIRLVPDMDPERVLEQLKAHLRKQLPWGLELGITVEACTGPWTTQASGPAFEAAEAALEKGYGVRPLKIGCGGSIPFVKPIAEAMGGAPALLIGVEDPYTNAHGENESLLLSDFYKACRSEVELFVELAARWGGK